MTLSDHLPASQIVVPVAATTKDGVIAELLDKLPIEDTELLASLRVAIDSRERELTTGIGRGVAVPHAWSEQVTGHLCALGVAREPIDFDAVDGQPCRVFFLCVFHPNDAAEHLHLLSAMAALLNDDTKREALERAESVADARAVMTGVAPDA